MSKLILVTGEEINCFHVDVFMANTLLIHTKQLTFVQAAEIFSKPASLKEITIELGDGDAVIYYGYQILDSIQRTPAIGPDALLIRLSR